MATTLDVIRRLTVIAQSKGVDELRRELESIASTVEKTGEKTLGAGRKFESLEKQLLPLVKAEKAFESQTRTIFNALSEGAIDADRATRALAAAGQRFNTLATQAKEAALAQTDAIEKQRQAYIEQGIAIRRAVEAQEAWNKVSRVNPDHKPKSAAESASVFSDEFNRQDEIKRTADRMVQLRSRYDDAYKAGLKYSEAVKEINELHKKGQITDEKRLQLLQRQKHEYTRVIEEEIGGGRERSLGQQPGNRLALHQARNLGFQVNDVLTGLFSGQSLGMIAAQQGGQIYQILSDGPGGAAGGVKRLMGYLGELVTPARLAAGAILGIGVAAAMAMNDAVNRTIALQQALNGIGALSGQTVGGLNRLATSAAAGGNISIAQSQSLAGGFAGAGLGGGQIGALLGSTRDFAKAFGLEVADAGKELAMAFRDPVKGAEELNRRFGSLGDATMQAIRRAEEQGNRQQAQAILMRAYNDAMSQVTVRTNALSDAMEGLKHLISNLWTRFGQALSPRTPQEELEAAMAVPRRAGGQMSRRMRQDLAMRGIDPDAAGGQVESNRLNSVMEAWRKAMEEAGTALLRGRNVELAQQSRVAGGYMREIMPWEEATKRFEDRIIAIRQAMESGALKGGEVDRAREALERYGNALRMVLTPMQQVQLNSALQIQQTLAMTAAQRAAVEAQRAFTAAIGEGKTRAEAIAAAEASINQARAEGLRQAQEALRDARNQTALAGLLPDERLRMEIRQQEESLRRQAVVGATSDLPAVFVPFKLGLDLATAALNEFTAALKPGGGVGRQASIPDDQYYAKFTLRAVSQAPQPLSPFGTLPDGGLSENISLRRLNQMYGTQALPPLPAPVPSYAPARTPAGGLAVDPRETERTIRQVTAERELGREREINLRFIRQTEISTAALNSTLDSQIQNFGRSTAEVSAAAKQQELLNQAAREGVPITDALQQSISRVSNEYGQAAARQERFRESLQLMNDVRGTVNDFGSSLAGAFIRGERGAKLLQTGLNSLLSSLSRMSMNLLMRGLFGNQNFDGGLLSQFMGAFLPGGGGGNLGDNWMPNARGNVFHYGSHVTAYAGGGVVNRPTFFPMARGGVGLMGEAGPEAIMPLRRGPDGKLGVAAANENRGGVGIVVNNYGRSDVSVQESRGPDGRRMIEVLVEEKVNGMVASGGADGAFRGRYGNAPRKVMPG